MKPKSLFPELTEAQLIKLMTKKQKAILEKLKRNGTEFQIQNVNQHPYIFIKQKQYSKVYDYIDDDYDDIYPITDYELCVGEWGD